MRIATLGDYHKYFSYFLYGTMEGSIRAGHWFRPIPLFHIPLTLVEEQIDFFRPEIMFAHCIFNRKPHKRDDVFDMLRRIRKKYGTKICYHMGDARSEPRYPHDISEIVDLCLVNNTGKLEEWSNLWNVPTLHWPYAALYQKEIAPVDERYRANIVFTGSLGGNEHHAPRTLFIKELQQSGLDIRTYPDPELGNSRFQTDLVAASSDAVLGFQMGGNIEGYVDVRPYQYIGAGALYFQDKHPNIDAFFKDGVHYVGYERDNATDLIKKINWYRGMPDEAMKIRQTGFEYCQRHHSTHARVEAVIQYFEAETRHLLSVDEIEWFERIKKGGSN